MLDAIAQFESAIVSAGLTAPKHIVMDGKIHRFAANGNAKDDSGWYVGYAGDLPAGAFGCWRLGLQQLWRADVGRKITPAEEMAHRARMADIRAAREMERVQRAQEAAEKARRLLTISPPARDDHPYLMRKGIKASGAREFRGDLLIPVCNQSGSVSSLQTIKPDGTKRFLTGGSVAGCYFTIDGLLDMPVCIAEGFATGASIHEATGFTVVVAFNAGNLMPVAESVRSIVPEADIIICADDDYRTEGNPGITAATEASRSVGGLLAVPNFGTDRPDSATDFNDLSTAMGLDRVRECIDAAHPVEARTSPGEDRMAHLDQHADELDAAPDAIPPQIRSSAPDRQPFSAPEITADELANARITPDCIVKGLYYADVGLMIAPGGVGKTTMMLWIAIHVRLRRAVFGCEIGRSGPVVFITAEDGREIMVARLRNIMVAMGLTEDERADVLTGIRIADVSGAGYKLTMVAQDVVIPSGNIEDIIAECQTIDPALIVIDPAVSFGVGEARVNDAEQGLVEAARRLRNALNCAIIYVHHSGKANARDGAVDQYGGRGGSAFADGARMVHVCKSMPPDEWAKATGEPLKEGQTGILLARPKMSYCPPVGDLYIRRTGYLFELVEPVAQVSKASRLEADANQVHQFLTYELAQGRYHTLRTVQDSDVGDITRDRKRAALSRLEVSGRVVTAARDGAISRGARTYLQPIQAPEKPEFDPVD